MTPLEECVAKAWQAWRAPPRNKVSGWANKHRKLSAEASAEPGQWRNARAPHTVAPMDALSPSDDTEVVILKWSAQSAKTEVINNFIGYIADEDPGPILCLQPNEKPMAEAFSKDRIAPMIRDTPRLRERFATGVGRTSKNTILHKAFPGGHLTIAGANSPSSLASRPIRFLLADEVNRWEKNKEGDAFQLAYKRTRTFWNRKILVVSTPTLEGVGISRQFENSLQHEWRLECPSCGDSQMPALKHFTFHRDKNKILTGVDYTCEHCGTVHDEKSEKKIKSSGEWVQTNDADPKRKGYHFCQWASPFASWRDTSQEWLSAQGDPGEMQVVVNTAFAEEWLGEGDQLDWESLYTRRSVYPYHADGFAIPAEVNHLLLLVDTQDSYLDWEVIGIGERMRTWGVQKGQIYGNTEMADVWDQLDDLRRRVWPTETGEEVGIFATGIDIKGHRQRIVKQWCYKRKNQRVYALAGLGKGAKKQIAMTRTKLDDGSKKKVDIYSVRVDDFKRDAISYMGETDSNAFGYCHWPKDQQGGVVAGYDQEVFEQLCAEREETKLSKGFPIKEFIKTRTRNEAFDLRHMLCSLVVIAKPPDTSSVRRATQMMPEQPAPAVSAWVSRGSARVQDPRPGNWMSRRR